MALMKLACVVSLAVCAFACFARPAQAFEREWHVGGGIGVAGLPRHYNAGPALGLHAAYGISDMFDVKLELLGSLHGLAEEVPPGVESKAGLYSAAAGLAYKLDIIQWVPYAGVLVGYYRVQGAVPSDVVVPRDDLGVSLALGIDYAASRNFGLGAQLRPHLYFLRNGAELQYGTFLLRAEYRWGW
jgi:hypothetical protein